MKIYRSEGRVMINQNAKRKKLKTKNNITSKTFPQKMKIK